MDIPGLFVFLPRILTNLLEAFIFVLICENLWLIIFSKLGLCGGSKNGLPSVNHFEYYEVLKTRWAVDDFQSTIGNLFQQEATKKQWAK
jgi:hypothetical protein